MHYYIQHVVERDDESVVRELHIGEHALGEGVVLAVASESVLLHFERAVTVVVGLEERSITASPFRLSIGNTVLLGKRGCVLVSEVTTEAPNCLVSARAFTVGEVVFSQTLRTVPKKQQDLHKMCYGKYGTLSLHHAGSNPADLFIEGQRSLVYMMNNAETSREHNVVITKQDGGPNACKLVVKARRPIAAGEELKFQYNGRDTNYTNDDIHYGYPLVAPACPLGQPSTAGSDGATGVEPAHRAQYDAVAMVPEVLVVAANQWDNVAEKFSIQSGVDKFSRRWFRMFDDYVHSVWRNPGYEPMVVYTPTNKRHATVFVRISDALGVPSLFLSKPAPDGVVGALFEPGTGGREEPLGFAGYWYQTKGTKAHPSLYYNTILSPLGYMNDVVLSGGEEKDNSTTRGTREGTVVLWGVNVNDELTYPYGSEGHEDESDGEQDPTEWTAAKNLQRQSTGQQVVLSPDSSSDESDAFSDDTLKRVPVTDLAVARFSDSTSKRAKVAKERTEAENLQEAYDAYYPAK